MTFASLADVRMPARLIAAAAVVAAILSCANTASASKAQPTMLQDDSLLLGDATRRDATLDEWKSLGVDTVKIGVRWRELAPSPGQRHKPSFDATDPAGYDSATWSRLDAAIEGANQRGMNVMIMIIGGAPDWASAASPGARPSGIQKPNAAEFKSFVHALGTRYSGSYNGLPRVGIWSVWNEPNLASWLGPQYTGTTPASPRLYRDLVYAGRDGLAAAGHGDDQLLLGELLPFARGPNGKTKVRPLVFLRELACVDARYRPYKGSAARKRGCTHFQPLPGTGLAYHPYTLAGGPKVRSDNADDATIAELGRVTKTLDKLTQGRRFATTTKLPLWLTEFGFQTDPPDPVQSPIKEVPAFMGESEWFAWRNKRVVSYSQYPFADDPIPDSGVNRLGGFQSGLRFATGRPKPGVYNAFQYPFFVRLRTPSSVEVFGAVRAAAPGAQVTIDSRVGRAKFTPLTGGALTTGDQGYFDKVLTVAGAGQREFRFRYSDAKSAVVKAIRP